MVERDRCDRQAFAPEEDQREAAEGRKHRRAEHRREQQHAEKRDDEVVVQRKTARGGEPRCERREQCGDAPCHDVAASAARRRLIRANPAGSAAAINHTGTP